MPGITVSFRSTQRGPISDGRIFHQVDAYEHDVAEAIADETQDVVLRKFNSRIRHQTPYYTTTIDTHEITSTRYSVRDNGVIYNHWLEGDGSRNSPVTIFPGYHAWEETEIEMKHKRRAIGRRILREYRSRGMLT